VWAFELLFGGGGGLEATTAVYHRLIQTPVVDFLLVTIELFSLVITDERYERVFFLFIWTFQRHTIKWVKQWEQENCISIDRKSYFRKSQVNLAQHFK